MLPTLLLLTILGTPAQCANGGCQLIQPPPPFFTAPDESLTYKEREAQRLAMYKQWKQAMAYQEMMARKYRLATRTQAPTSQAQENLAYLQGQVMAESYQRFFYAPTYSYYQPFYGYGRRFSDAGINPMTPCPTGGYWAAPTR